MMSVIDNLDSISGWSASGTAVIYGLNDVKDSIAGGLAHSLIFKFVAAGDYVSKTLTPVSTTGYTYVTLSVMSQKLGSGSYRSYNDFSYKIDFGSGKEYYLPVSDKLSDVSFYISDISTIDRIRITALDTTTDYLVVSYCVMHLDELPLDAFVAIKTAISSEFDLTKFLCGTITGSAGASSITFSATPKYIRRYSKIMITGGGHTEYHHISTQNGLTFSFTSYYDGALLLNSYAGASVYVVPACEYGRYESEIVLPSANIWMIQPEETNIESDVQFENDTWKSDGSANEQQTGKWYKYDMLIDAEGWTMEEVAYVAEIVKKILGRKIIWINGKKCELRQEGAAAMIEPSEVIQSLPKIQFSCSCLIKDDVWSKIRTSALQTTTNTFTLQS